MSKIYVMSQFEALKFKLTDYPGTWNVVSITDPAMGLMFSQYFNDVFRLEFLDDGKDVPSTIDLELLLRFVDKTFENKHNLLIHCFMGVSRSYALAKFLDSFSKNKLKQYNKYNQKFLEALRTVHFQNSYPFITKGDHEVFAHPRETASEFVTCPICMGHDMECNLCQGNGKVSKYWYL